MIKVLELFDGLKIKVHSNGEIETFDHNTIRKSGKIDNRKGKILKPWVDYYGYERVVLTKEGIRKTYLVHRLVALAFLPNPNKKETVNHVDGNKRNNDVSNLEWATCKEQKLHSISHHLCDKHIEILKMCNEDRAKKIKLNGIIYNSKRECQRLTAHDFRYINKYGKEVMPNE